MIPETLTPLAGLVLVLAALLLLALVIWVGLACVRLWAQIQREKPQLVDILDELARRAVQAAGQWIETNPERRQYAIKMVFLWLEKMGIRGVLLDLVEEAVERAVANKKNAEFFVSQGKR